MIEVLNKSEDWHLQVALWRALAALKCLTKLVFLVEYSCQRNSTFQQLSLLRNIRCDCQLDHHVEPTQMRISLIITRRFCRNRPNLILSSKCCDQHNLAVQLLGLQALPHIIFSMASSIYANAGQRNACALFAAPFFPLYAILDLFCIGSSACLIHK